LQKIHYIDMTIETPVNTRRQHTAFPANFIHSLDATHMIMSAIACKEHGLNFAVAHDSFWTHACDIDAMNKVLRGQFIKLHEQPLMDNLRNEFIERYKDHMIPTSILKRVSLEETELFDSESATFMDPLDLDDEAEELLDDAVSDSEYDDVPLEDTMVQTEASEPVEKMGGPRKVRWVPIKFPPLPPRRESGTTQVRKNRCFFY
jgi:DNA-directed RNA polymerase